MPSRPSRRAARRPTRPPPRRSGTARALLRLAGGMLVLGAAVALVPPAHGAALRLRDSVMDAITAGRRAEVRRERIAEYARRYEISTELAVAIEQAALAEGIDPELAFRLVRVESEFHPRAVSSAGAQGLTQLMPATAASLQPGITPEQIFDRDTNLRLGFRYLRWLLEVYDGRLDEALHAYNRGPGTVDRIRAAGGDPANGYADRVLGRRPGGVPYRGNGLSSGSDPAWGGF